MDLRVRRTRHLLQRALLELVAEKGLESVTVRKLTERAMVNRATFYRHYRDKDDLIQHALTDELKALAAQVDPQPVTTVTPEVPPPAWVAFFEHVERHAGFYRATLGVGGALWFHDEVAAVLQRLALTRLKAAELPAEARVPPEYAVSFFAHGVLGALRWWLASDPRATPHQMAQWLMLQLTLGTYYALGLALPEVHSGAIDARKS